LSLGEGVYLLVPVPGGETEIITRVEAADHCMRLGDRTKLPSVDPLGMLNDILSWLIWLQLGIDVQSPHARTGFHVRYHRWGKGEHGPEAALRLVSRVKSGPSDPRYRWIIGSNGPTGMSGGSATHLWSTPGPLRFELVHGPGFAEATAPLHRPSDIWCSGKGVRVAGFSGR
jgi:hypothetical protein